MCRRLRNVALTLAVLVAVSLVAALGGNAEPQQQITWTEGASSVVVTLVDSRAAGGNTIQDFIFVRDVTGDITGTVTSTFRGVLHPNGQFTFEGRSTYTGTTPCGTGSFDTGFAGNNIGTTFSTGQAQSVDGGRNSAHILFTGTFANGLFRVSTLTGSYRCT
jgi:hypothetical protein